MLVNLSDVLKSEGRQVQKEVLLEMTRFESGAGTFEILSKSPITFLFVNAGPGKVRIEGSASLTFRTCCDRCLTESPITLELVFRRTAAPMSTADEEADEWELEDDYRLDTEAFVRDEILIHWPVKILCREDCRGICPVCGRNRNIQECGCDTFVPDPRMAGIQDIFNMNNKEV